MDIWSSDDEGNNKKVDVWEGEREWIIEHMASAAQEEKGKEEKPTVKMGVKAEPKEEEDKNEKPKKVVVSI